MTDHAAPAFSMGTAKRGKFPNQLINTNCFECLEKVTRNDRDSKQLGPNAYNVTMADKKKEPSFSMGARTRSENTKLVVPGAGSYAPPSKIIES